MLANCCIRNYKPLEKTRSLHNLGIRIFRFLHFNSLFVTVKYASNMAARFHVQFSAVTLNSINRLEGALALQAEANATPS